MKKYALLQAPVEEGDYTARIKIVDQSTKIGKMKVDMLTKAGYNFAGWIESELSVNLLRAGFDYDASVTRSTIRKHANVAIDALSEIMRETI